LLPGWVEVDGENLDIGILFHELHELGTGHQSGTEQTRRFCRLEPTRETQQTAREGTKIHDRLGSIGQSLQSASKRHMETISTFQGMIHRRGKPRVLRSKRLVPRRSVGSDDSIEFVPGQLVCHDLTVSFLQSAEYH
jgi:methionine aminopeptidase